MQKMKLYLKGYIENILHGNDSAIDQVSLVQQSWQKVLPIAPQAAEIFYKKLKDRISVRIVYRR